MADWLSKLPAPAGSSSSKRRLGRGTGSGLGKTSGKGQKGQKARHPGNFGKLAFQGGQTPIQRRLPKRGFTNIFRVETAEVNVGSLAKKFAAGATVDPTTLFEAGLIKGKPARVKVLGTGELPHALTVRAHGVSAGARAKIEKAGGKVELIEPPQRAEGEAPAS